MEDKRFITLIMILIFTISNSFLIYPQEHNEIDDIKTSGTNLNIIEKNSISSVFPYKLTDGTKLSYNDTLRVVKYLEINKALLKEEKNYHIISNVTSTIFAMGLLGWVWLNKDQRNPYIFTPYMFAATVGLGTSIFVTKSIAEKKLNKAVGNYNLYIMGIQIQNNQEVEQQKEQH